MVNYENFKINMNLIITMNLLWGVCFPPFIALDYPNETEEKWAWGGG